jgi:hypothetical protein
MKLGCCDVNMSRIKSYHIAVSYISPTIGTKLRQQLVTTPLRHYKFTRVHSQHTVVIHTSVKNPNILRRICSKHC